MTIRTPASFFVSGLVQRPKIPHLAKDTLPAPTRYAIQPRHTERSVLASMDDDMGRPTPEIIDLAIRAIIEARAADLRDISDRIPIGAKYPDIWPGEHYKLLAGIVKLLQPKTVVEIGTAGGLSALSMLKYLPACGKLFTFDLVDWRQYPGAILRDADFADGRLTQYLDDLSQPRGFQTHRRVLESADLIFVDAAKDGVQERRFLRHFSACRFRRPPLIVFDDIRVMNMVSIWRSVCRPKLDLTSFGHWSGTGLIL